MAQKVATARKMKSRQETTSLGPPGRASTMEDKSDVSKAGFVRNNFLQTDMMTLQTRTGKVAESTWESKGSD